MQGVTVNRTGIALLIVMASIRAWVVVAMPSERLVERRPSVCGVLVGHVFSDIMLIALLFSMLMFPLLADILWHLWSMSLVWLMITTTKCFFDIQTEMTQKLLPCYEATEKISFFTIWGSFLVVSAGFISIMIAAHYPESIWVISVWIAYWVGWYLMLIGAVVTLFDHAHYCADLLRTSDIELGVGGVDQRDETARLLKNRATEHFLMVAFAFFFPWIAYVFFLPVYMDVFVAQALIIELFGSVVLAGCEYDL